VQPGALHSLQLKVYVYPATGQQPNVAEMLTIDLSNWPEIVPLGSPLRNEKAGHREGEDQ
jgi:hypothetical protein